MSWIDSIKSGKLPFPIGILRVLYWECGLSQKRVRQKKKKKKVLLLKKKKKPISNLYPICAVGVT